MLLLEGCYSPAVGYNNGLKSDFQIAFASAYCSLLVCPRSIGLAHASYLDSNGNNVEYGDSSSPMGSGTVGTPNSSHPIPSSASNMSTCTCIMQPDD